MGKPAPHGVSGKPQRVDGARRNTPPTAFCFESYAVNTGRAWKGCEGGWTVGNTRLGKVMSQISDAEFSFEFSRL